MKAIQFSRWISQLAALNSEQREQLKASLLARGPFPADMIATPSCCPHCQSSELRPWGSSGGLPRYRCKCCGKTSNPLTGTPMARLRKRHLWQAYAEALTHSLTVRRAAKHCGISRTRLSCGGTGSSLRSPLTRPSMSPASSRPMKPSFWSRSRDNAICRALLANAEAVRSDGGYPPSRFPSWSSETAAASTPTFSWRSSMQCM